MSLKKEYSIPITIGRQTMRVKSISDGMMSIHPDIFFPNILTTLRFSRLLFEFVSVFFMRVNVLSELI